MTKTEHPNVYAPLPRARAKPPILEAVHTRLRAAPLCARGLTRCAARRRWQGQAVQGARDDDGAVPRHGAAHGRRALRPHRRQGPLLRGRCAQAHSDHAQGGALPGMVQPYP
eukprot:scaffold57434_cov63-Phaeocystis_antarctica.AAC.4